MSNKLWAWRKIYEVWSLLLILKTWMCGPNVWVGPGTCISRGMVHFRLWCPSVSWLKLQLRFQSEFVRLVLTLFILEAIKSPNNSFFDYSSIAEIVQQALSLEKTLWSLKSAVHFVNLNVRARLWGGSWHLYFQGDAHFRLRFPSLSWLKPRLRFCLFLAVELFRKNSRQSSESV